MRIKSIHICLLLFVLAHAAGCGGAMREEKNEADDASYKTDSISMTESEKQEQDSVSVNKDKELETSSDSAGLRQAVFQRIVDFYDYVEIISNRRYDRELREEASKQAIEILADSSKKQFSGVEDFVHFYRSLYKKDSIELAGMHVSPDSLSITLMDNHEIGAYQQNASASPHLFIVYYLKVDHFTGSTLVKSSIQQWTNEFEVTKYSKTKNGVNMWMIKIQAPALSPDPPTPSNFKGS